VEDAVVKRATKHGMADKPAGHTQRAYEGVRNRLCGSEIVPGQKISYRDLSERLGMSQTPVIQALKWLEFQQLVRHEPHRGYYTAPISLQEVEEIYDLRKLIELDLLQNTLKQIDTQGIKRLRVALDAHLKASKNVHLYDRLLKDMEFHLELAALSGRLVQQKALKNLFDLLYLKYGGKFLFSTSMDSADTDHQELFERIAKHDLKGARTVLARHILRVKKHVLQGVDHILKATRI
jgi:DNA-binding GntR family transcriptional regulator